MVVQSKGSLLLELQQRSTKFDSIIEKHQNIRYGTVDSKFDNLIQKIELK